MMPIEGEIGLVSKQSDETDDARVIVSPGVNLIPTSGPPRLLSLLRTLQFKLVLPIFVTLQLCRLARNEDYDVIMFYNFNIITAFPSLIAGLLFRTPIVIDFNDNRLDSRDWSDRLRDKIYLYVVDPWLSGGICINTNMTALLRTDNTVVVRGEPSVKIADECEIDRDIDSPLTVFYGGRLDDVRGIDILLEAAPEIVRRQDVEVRVGGYGPRFEEVQQQVEEMDINRVSFLGDLSNEQYREELVEANIAVNLQLPDAPGNEYTFPTKILDYLATGNVVVSTRMSDLEVVLDDILVFTEPNADDITTTVSEVCDDFSAHSQRIAARHTWVQKNCSPEKRVEAISKVLDEACS
jgi:glycosyltransferase involved in cell wall biosynthesis